MGPVLPLRKQVCGRDLQRVHHAVRAPPARCWLAPPPPAQPRARAALPAPTARASPARRRHEYYLAARLGIQPSDSVLDCGCGIGGPLRNLGRFTGAPAAQSLSREAGPFSEPCRNLPVGASITGVTLNQYQARTTSPSPSSAPLFFLSSHPLTLSPSHPLTLSPSHPLTLSPRLPRPSRPLPTAAAGRPWQRPLRQGRPRAALQARQG